MIELKPETRVHGIWFVGGKDQDWLAVLLRQPSEPWKLQYRFRYYVGEGNDPFDGKDRKSWWCGSFAGDDPTPFLPDVVAIGELVSKQIGAPLQYLPVNGDGVQAGKLLLTQSWAHGKAGS